MSRRRTGRSIDSTRHIYTPLKLLIQADKHNPQHSSRANGHKRRRAVDDKGNRIRWRGAVGVHVARIDAARVGDGVYERQGRRTLGRRSRDGVADP